MLLELNGENFFFNREEEKTDLNSPLLINETLGYAPAKYVYGSRVFFKTYKLEKRKKFNYSAKDLPDAKNKSAIIHTSPAFILSGSKKNEITNLYYEKSGDQKRIVAETLVKVLWYNSYQEKISEEYMPIDFFVDDQNIFSNSVNVSSVS